jgi:hypothetical protein
MEKNRRGDRGLPDIVKVKKVTVHNKHYSNAEVAFKPNPKKPPPSDDEIIELIQILGKDKNTRMSYRRRR